MVKKSAGLLMFKIANDRLKVFIVHPGGPYWKDKDSGTWSIPKGEVEEGEDFLQCAIREMREETGIDASGKNFFELGFITQKSGKQVYCWAFEGDWAGLIICSSYAEVEWPYKSGKIIKVPEVDKAGFFGIEQVRKKINTAQSELLDRLQEILIKNDK